MRTVQLKPQARLDLLEIWNHLAAEDLSAAEKFNNQVDVEIARLRAFPGIGHFRPETGKTPLRFWKVLSWFIIYRYDDKNVVLLRIVHCSRDLRKTLKKQP